MPVRRVGFNFDKGTRGGQKSVLSHLRQAFRIFFSFTLHPVRVTRLLCARNLLLFLRAQNLCKLKYRSAFKAMNIIHQRQNAAIIFHPSFLQRIGALLYNRLGQRCQCNLLCVGFGVSSSSKKSSKNRLYSLRRNVSTRAHHSSRISSATSLANFANFRFILISQDYRRSRTSAPAPKYSSAAASSAARQPSQALPPTRSSSASRH